MVPTTKNQRKAIESVYKMQKGLLHTGTIGGIIGVVTAATGIVWGYLLLTHFVELSANVSSTSFMAVYLLSYGYGSLSGILASSLIPYPSSWILLLLSTVLFSMLLVINGILIGLGFYDVAQGGRGLLGAVCLGACIIGSLLAGALLVLGVAIKTTTTIGGYVLGAAVQTILIPISFPNVVFILEGLVALGVSLLIVGITSLSIRKTVDRTESALAGGILCILGGVFGVLQIIPLLLLRTADTSSMYSSVVMYAAYTLMPSAIWIFQIFALLLVAFILWIRVFYSYGSQK
nr:hypothetical protein [Candidatus Freyarchaeota archaeon]